MGVPAFFRWLSKKYPSIVVNAVEKKAVVIDDVTIEVDATEPNPMGVEFDNLYLDMNGIIHPCTHSEYKVDPKNEDEMFEAIFEYIDRLFNIVRPRRVLYMAIDGVAPRAKMNQQRSRRFRAAKDTAEKQAEIDSIRDKLEADGMAVPPKKEPEDHFDRNCITPGTPFMSRLAVALRYYIHDRLTNNPAWAGLQIILSDANVPGEGEHKIMDYIRRQRAHPDHDPNTHHCLCGADADLIMLGLATHEPHFTIIREEFIPNKQRPCDLCGQYGHELKDCQGMPRSDFSDFANDDLPAGEANFIFIRLNVLREYLQRELAIPNLPFPYSIERAIDDWVFMCFFVGNDFLPHLPSLEIREGAIDRLISIYKKTIYRTQGYLTEDGFVNLSRVQLILSDLGEMEDDIFKHRQENELQFRARNKQKKKRMKANSAPTFLPAGQFQPVALGRGRGSGPKPLFNPLQTSIEMRKAAMSSANDPGNGEGGGKGVKRKQPDSDSDEEPPDEVRLWEDGWKERYYQSKFEVSATDTQFRYKVVRSYVEGLCWVMRYYYQGCPSWKWFFPFHYAPFASDFMNVGDLKIDFPTDTTPFKPIEQLMGVFPAASRSHVPPKLGELMLHPKSPIIDFYPIDFMVDLNGKKYAWQGVALLPFVEEGRLLLALEELYDTLTNEENRRNIRGSDRLFVSQKHPLFEFLETSLADKEKLQWAKVSTSLTKGMSGDFKDDPTAAASGRYLASPVMNCKDVELNTAVCVEYRDTEFGPDHVFSCARIREAKSPERTLKPGDWDEKAGRGRGRGFIPDFRGGGGRGRSFSDRGGRGGSPNFRGGGGRGSSYQPMIGFTRDIPHARVGDAGHRMLDAGIAKYGNVPPPSDSYNMRGRGGMQHNNNNNRGRYGGGGMQQRPQRSHSYSEANSNRGSTNAWGGQSSWQSVMRNQAAAFQQNLYNELSQQQQPQQRPHMPVQQHSWFNPNMARGLGQQRPGGRRF